MTPPGAPGPRVLKVVDDPVTGWPKALGVRASVAHVPAFARLGEREGMTGPVGAGWLRWLALAAQADVVQADGPAAVWAGYLLSWNPRILPGSGDRPVLPPPGPNGLPERIKLVASGAAWPGHGPGGWLTRRGLRAAARVVASTAAEAERYVALGVSPDRVVVIPPGVSPAPPPPDPVAFRRSLDVPDAARLVVAAGRFDVASDLRSAVWAFDVLKYAAPDLHLVLVGDGPERARVERFARAVGHDDFRVRFAGGRVGVAEAVAAADVVWVTHARGGVDVALAAMAAGRPVAAFGTPELAEVVADGVTGRLVPPRDRIRLAAVTRELLDRPDAAARLGAAGREAAARFPAEGMVTRLDRVYDELTRGIVADTNPAP